MDRPIIHRYWSGPPSDLNDWTEQVVRSLHPYAEIKLWGPGDWPVNVEQVRKEDRPRHESNVARYRALHRFGGMWLDHDVVPLRDMLDATSNNWTAGLGKHREGCAMRFNKYHPYLFALLEEIEASPDSDDCSANVSGARLLNKVGMSEKIEERIIPADATGRWIATEPPIAIHLWETSRRRFYGEGGLTCVDRRRN